MTIAPKKLLSTLLVIELAGAMLAAVSRGQGTPATSNPPPTRFAVVNIVDLFENLKEKTAADTMIETKKKAYDEASRKAQAEIQLAQEALGKTYKQGTPEYVKQQDDLLDMTVKFQVDTQVNQQKLFLALRMQTALLYKKINEAVAAYSQTYGIAMVFVEDNPSVEGARTQEQLQAMVTVRKVLYVHPSFDITNAILTKMNTEYELGTRGK